MLIYDKGYDLLNPLDAIERNKQDIQAFKDANQTIAEFGITVVGILSSVDQLPASGDNFGDAYLIGTETPYDMRVWTRNIPEQRAMWVDLGAFPLQGPKGDKGDKGSQIYSDNGLPTITGQEGDIYINTATGILYQYTTDNWVEKFSIKGPMGPIGPQGKQGIQGEKGSKGDTGAVGPRGIQGPKGDYGPSFNIQGTLASTANLPAPTADMKSKGYAYIIPDTEGVKHVWVIQGTDTLMWTDLGTAGVQGERGPQGIGIDTLTDLNMTLGDTTVQYDTTDGIQLTSTGRATYNGEQHDFTTDLDLPIIGTNGITIDKAADSEKIEISGSGLVQKGTKTGVRNNGLVYGYNGTGTGIENKEFPVNVDSEGGTIPIRKSNGELIALVSDSPADTVLLNKKYVDDNYVKKLNPNTPGILYGRDYSKNEVTVRYSDEASNGTIAKRTDTGTLKVETPTEDSEAANKKYVDEAVAGANPQTFKTLFGNQSIVGTGNIDLFKHHVKFEYTSTTGVVYTYYTDIISSQNFPIDSLTDLKTYLGNTFIKDIYGYGVLQTTSKLVFPGIAVNESFVTYHATTGDVSQLSIINFTLSDTVTTI